MTVETLPFANKQSFDSQIVSLVVVRVVNVSIRLLLVRSDQNY